MDEIELTKKENTIFQWYMIRNNTAMINGLIDWIVNEPPKRRMITSDTTHERVFHLMYPSLKKQVVIGTGKGGYKKWGVKKFTLDFYDKDNNIAYEIDGKSHETEIGRLRDKYRDMLLNYLCGIRTVRYSNKEVENMLKRRIKELGVEHFGIDNK